MQKCENFPRSLCSLAYIDYLDVGVLPAVCEAFIVPCLAKLHIMKVHCVTKY